MFALLVPLLVACGDDGECPVITEGEGRVVVGFWENDDCSGEPVTTNSFPIAEHLLKHSKNTIMLSGGAIYREQNIILSPFENDVTRNFYARRMFMGAQGIGPLGLMEADPLLIQAEQKLIGQADELVVLVDSSKFEPRSSLVLCPLTRIGTIITDDRITDKNAAMVEAAEINLIVAEAGVGQAEDEAAS